MFFSYEMQTHIIHLQIKHNLEGKEEEQGTITIVQR